METLIQLLVLFTIFYLSALIGENKRNTPALLAIVLTVFILVTIFRSYTNFINSTYLVWAVLLGLFIGSVFLHKFRQFLDRSFLDQYHKMQ